MSLKSVFATIGHAVGLSGSHAVATVQGAATASLDKLGGSLAGSLAVAAERSGPVGTAVAAAIRASDAAAVADPTMTGAAKLKLAIAASVPAIVAEAAKVGLTGIEAEAERFAEMAIENALSLLKETPLAKLAAALLHLVGA